MKRLLSMLLAAMMIISMAATAAMAVNSDLPFEDVDPNAWYYEHIKDAYAMDLMHGQSDIKFAPEVPMKRAEFVKILANIVGLTDEEAASKNYAAEAAKKFDDVAKDSWFASVVGWANSLDILRGDGTGEVRPDDFASRQEIAVMFGRFMKNAISFNWENPSEVPDFLFIDNDEIASWAYNEVYLLKAMGIIEGNEDRSFRPEKPMLRAEIAKVAAEFVKFRNVVLDESISEDPELTISLEADATINAEALNALTGSLNNKNYFTSVKITNIDDALTRIAAVEPGNTAEIELNVTFEAVQYSVNRTYKLSFTREAAAVPDPEVPEGLTFSYTAEADENVTLDKISAIVSAEANADGKFEKVEITNGDAVVAAMKAAAAGSSSEIDVAVKYTLGEFTADRTYKLSFTREAAAVPDPEVPEGLTFSYTAEADENVTLEKINAIVNAEANADGKFEKVEITNGDAVVAAMKAVAAGSSSEIDVAVKYKLGEFTADRTYKLSFTRKAAVVPDPEVPEGLTFSYTAEADEEVALEKISAIVNAEANADSKFEKVEITNGDAVVAAMKAAAAGSTSEIDVSVKYTLGEFTADRTYKLSFTRNEAVVPDPEVPEGLTFSYIAEADEDVALDKISAIVNAETNADGKFEKVEITNGDAVVAAMKAVAAGSSSEIDVAVKYTLGEFTADRTYKLSFTRNEAPVIGLDATAANIGTVYDENGIKISYAKKIEVDGKAILADSTGVHGGHESKVVRTPYGTFSVYVNGSRVDEQGVQWDKFTVVKISANKFEVVFDTEYPHSQGSCAPNIFAGKDSTIYVSIISVDQPKYVNSRREGAWLTIYEIDAKTNKYQSYQANPDFVVTGKGGYGYSQPIPDIENGKIYALYTGGDIPGQLAWFTFDINSRKWMPECRTVETEFRCCYFNAYADGNGGFIFVGQRDVKKSTFAKLINNPAFGGSGYIQDIIYLFRVPDATKEEVISKMVRDPKYTSSTPLSGLLAQRTYGTGCTYLDSDGNFHLLYSNTKGENSTLYHSVYDKELNVISPDKSMLALFTTSKTTPRRLFMTQAPDGTFYIFASNVPKDAATAYTPAQFDIYKSSDGINFTRFIDTTVEIKTEDGTTFNCREMKFIVTAPRNNSTMDGTVGIMFYYPKTEGYSEYHNYYYMAIDFVN